MTPPITISNPTGSPSLVPPLFTYHNYFARDETDNFRNHYIEVLWTYKINN